MKMPKGFNKWTLQQQEEFFIKRLQELYAIESDMKRNLAKIRGGNRLNFSEIERPDEIALKGL
jgi:hypothetical protein